jgi:cytochrome P450
MKSSQSKEIPRFSVADPEFSITSASVREAREQSWYAHTNYGIAVLRYDEASRLLKHHNLRQGSVAWPAHHGVKAGPFARWWSTWMLNLEGEDHHRIRRLMSPGFSPRYIQTFVPRFQDLANELIESFERPDHCEFVSEFAQPYAARVIAMLLGAPESEWPFIAREAATLGLAMGVTIRQYLPKIEAALARLSDFCEALIGERMVEPRDDFITRIVRAQVDEDKLSPQELLDTLVLLVFGGFDTTRNQLGLAMQCFLENPDQWRLLAERPELGRNAVEEVMRTHPTTTWVTREALEDFTFEGLRIAKGTTIHLWTWSTGTDPRVVSDFNFDITAERPPHFGFGGGAHFCLGAMLARVDMSEALLALARRLRSPFIDGKASWLPLSGNTGPITLPISFTPGT